MTIVSVSLEAGIATFCMRDPKRRNALGVSMLTELIAAFEALRPETRVVILRAGPDDPVWSAGFDIRALRPGHDPLACDGLLRRLFDRVAACPAPVIGMLHGSTWGGGTDLALRCDILIGDTTSQLAFTPARLGLPYDGDGLLNVLLRAGPAIALEMFATADPIAADRALATGLLNHLVQPADLEPFTIEMAKRIAANAPLTVSSAKQHLRAFASAIPVPAALAQVLAESRAKALSSSDYAEGLDAFAAKRKPTFTGR